MSLIITSNIPKDADRRPDTSNIFKPYSYQNRLLNTMKIPPMSEIALESCKITKNGLISVSSSNSNYNTYFGADPDQNLDQSTTQPFFGICGSDGAFSGGSRLERNPTDFAKDVTTGLGSAVYHPALVTGVGTSGVKCTVEKDATTNDFKGYRWTSTQNEENTNKDDEFTFTDISHNASSAATIDDNEVEATTNAGIYMQNRQFALSQSRGECIMDFSASSSATRVWQCGLSRINTDKGWAGGYIPDSYNVDYGDGQPFKPTIGGDGGMFYDIVVARVGDFLRVYQPATLTTSNAVTVGAREASDLLMKEIVYYGYPGAEPPFNKATPYELKDNAGGSANITKVKFTLTNEHIRIDVLTDGGYQLLTDNIQTSANIVTAGGVPEKKNLTLPRTASQWNMYPTFHCRGVGSSITLDSIDHYEVQPKYDPLTYHKTNWWGRCEAGGPSMTRWARNIDIRAWNDYSSANLLVPKVLGGDEQMEDYQFQLIMMPTQIYGSEMTAGANTSNTFGFDNQFRAFPIAANIDELVQFFASNNVAVIASRDSLFVRLNNFTQQSINARQGTVSKIIAHLPRFDNAGNETGGLFFQPGEKTYVALNNTETIYVNSFDVDYVYDNETFCKAITGKSITVFHIRQAK